MRSKALYESTAKRLKPVSDCADFEAKCLLEQYFSLTLSDVYLDKEINTDNLSSFEAAVQKRLSHYPLQYILGSWEFMGYPFCVNENCLIPRPETELLCEYFFQKISKQSVVYDLCSGSGCIAVSVHKKTGAKVFALEKYDGTFSVLKENIALNQATGVVPLQWDITQSPGAGFEKADFILSNPPYIKSADLSYLQVEVQKEPLAALDGGEDGLFFYRAIEKNFISLLKPGGYAAFEIGEGQEADLLKIFHTLKHVETIADYNHIKRIVVFRKEIE